MRCGNVRCDIIREADWLGRAAIAVREVGEYAAAVGRLPPKELVRKHRRIVPGELLCYEGIEPGFAIDLRQLPGVTKAIRIPAYLHIHTEFVLEKPLADEDLTNHGFTVRHVEVRLDPHAAHQLPASFTDALLNLGKLSRIFVTEPFVVAHTRLGIGKSGVFVHELQGGAKGVPN